MKLIEAKSITATYLGGMTVFSDVSLNVEKKQNLTILGPNGAGKSTLLKILAGVKTPSSGTVTYNKTNGRDLRTGLMFQQPLLLPWLSVIKNIRLGSKYTKENNTNFSAETLLEKVGLSGLGKRRPHTLSGGQRQRVALARTLAQQPDVLLLDEPFSAVDIELRNSLRYLVHKLTQDYGITIVLVTHQQDEATAFDSNVVHMSELTNATKKEPICA